MDNSNICTKPEDINATMKIAQKMHHSLANVCNSPCTTMQVFAVGDNTAGVGVSVKDTEWPRAVSLHVSIFDC